MKPLLIILTWVLALTFPNLSLGQTAPNLGTTSTFAVFTAVGAVTNDGVSTLVRGDLGTDVGAISGFAAGQVVANIRDENSPQSAQAAADVQVAYNQLLANSCGTTLNPEIGGQTLTSGVYCQITADPSTLCGTLTLSGPGVFIIKLNSALTTCTDSKIVLINGATADNVFFQVNGAVNLGINSMFSGTIVANGAINLLTGASLQGRALSIAGAINLNGNQVSIPAPAPSPVSLISFNAQKEAQTAVLSWSTAEEINSDRFEVEHSLNGKNWQMVGSVAAQGNSKNTQWYSFTDANPANGSNLYRLRMVDKDGTFELTRAKSLEFDITLETAMYPNPVAERLLLKMGDLSQIRRVELYNASGKSVLESETVTASGIDVKGLPTGFYVVRVTRTNGSTDIFKILKQ